MGNRNCCCFVNDYCWCPHWKCCGGAGQKGQYKIFEQEGKKEEGNGARRKATCCGPVGLYMVDPASDVSLANDCDSIRHAMEGCGTRNTDLIRILANKSPKQMERMKVIWRGKYQSELEEWVTGDTTGDFERVLVAMMNDTAEADARVIKNAIDGIGTKDTQLREIITTRNNQDMISIKKAYLKLYNKSVESHIASDTSGYYQQTLLACVSKTDYLCARIHSAIVGLGTDDMRLIRIFSMLPRHAPKLRKIMDEFDDVHNIGYGHALENELSMPTLAEIKAQYQIKFGLDLVEHIKSDTFGQYQNTLLALTMEPAELLAKDFRYAVEGLGTSDDMLIELATCYSNTDIVDAAKIYSQRYGNSLAADIKSDTSWDYKDTLVDLVTPNNNRIAEALKMATKGLGTHDQRLIANLTGRSRAELREIMETFQNMYGKSLEDVVRSETSFNYKKTLVYLLRQAQEDFLFMDHRNLKRIQDV